MNSIAICQPVFLEIRIRETPIKPIEKGMQEHANTCCHLDETHTSPARVHIRRDRELTELAVADRAVTLAAEGAGLPERGARAPIQARHARAVVERLHAPLGRLARHSLILVRAVAGEAPDGRHIAARASVPTRRGLARRCAQVAVGAAPARAAHTARGESVRGQGAVALC